MTPSNQQVRTAEEFYYFCQENPDFVSSVSTMAASPRLHFLEELLVG